MRGEETLRPRLSATTLLATVMVTSCTPAIIEEPDAEKMIEGTASVIDGDTLEIHGQRIRLSGIDASERGSRCGQINVYQKAALALSDMIGSGTVSCEIVKPDPFGRKIARCNTAGRSLESIMAEAGWARDWARYSKRAFAEDERSAWKTRKGIRGTQVT